MASGTIKAVASKSDIANMVKYQTPTSDADTFLDGITIVSSPSGISHLPQANQRMSIITYTLLPSPVRKVQYAIDIAGKEYRRTYLGTWSDWVSIDDNIVNGNIGTKYLNDTSKTGMVLLQNDFANVNARNIQFYCVRPSDDNMYGWMIKMTDSYGYGFFSFPGVGDTCQVVNNNGTWTRTKLATDSQLTPTDYTTTGLSGNNCTFDRGGYCRIGNLVIVNIRVNISGSGANVTGFAAPKNIIGFGGYDGNADKAAFGYMNTSGSLVIPTAYGNSGAVMFSFSYIT